MFYAWECIFYFVHNRNLFTINIQFFLINIEKIMRVITFDGIHTFALTDHALEFTAVKQLSFLLKKQNIFHLHYTTKNP